MKSSLLIFCVAMAVLSGVSGDVQVVPKFQQVADNGSALVQCSFDNQLNACQAKVWWGNNTWASVDLFKDAPPVPVKNADGETLMMVQYAGEGFASKQCGAFLTGVQYGNYLVQCRGRNKENLWDQGFGLVASDTRNHLVSTTQNLRFMVAEVGQDVSVLMVAEEKPLTECDIWTPSAGPLDLPAGEVPPTGSRYVPYGTGLQNGQCGYTLTNVTQADAGVWWWMGKTDKVSWQMTVVAIDAAPVGKPVLTVRPKTLRAGQPLYATCVMPTSVPVSNVGWLLNDVMLVTSPVDDMANREDKFPWESQKTNQTLRYLLKSSDNGKYLKCRVTHSNMPEARTSNEVLIRLK